MSKYVLKKYLPLAIVSVMAFAGCSSDNGGGQRAMQMPAPLVKVAVVEQKDAPYLETYVAQTEGSRAVEVRAQVSGILKEKRYNEGQFVKAGDTLFVIEPETYQAALVQAQGALDQANATLRNAKLNFDRTKNLYGKNAVSKQSFDQAQANYDTAKAAVESAVAAVTNAKIQLGYTQVAAPVSGYTSKANFSVGNLISAAGSNLLTVVNQVDPIYVNFSVPSTTMIYLRTLASQGKMKYGDLVVELTLEDGSAYSEKGPVVFFDKMVNLNTGDIKARAEFKNSDMILLPGQYVKAALHGFTLVNAIVVPQKAIMQLQGQQMVIVVDEQNIAHYRPVKLGVNLGNNYLIDEGLNPGERIVVEGNNKVMNGAPVSIAPDAPATQGKM